MTEANDRAGVVIDTIEAVILAYRCGERADADSATLSLAVQHAAKASRLVNGIWAAAFLAESAAVVARTARQ